MTDYKGHHWIRLRNNGLSCPVRFWRITLLTHEEYNSLRDTKPLNESISPKELFKDEFRPIGEADLWLAGLVLGNQQPRPYRQPKPPIP